MEIISSLCEWHNVRSNMLVTDETLGYVATMGNLHAGHASLIKRSVAENGKTVVSIFVNPTQFNNQEDLNNYPRTLKEDSLLCENANVDYIFAPYYNELYPDDYHYKMQENTISTVLEGKHRPGHFDGVLTVVLKFLMLIKPHRTYFSEKDFQQLQLIKGMCRAFFLDIDVIACPIIRNEFGLPLSSRNNRLTAVQFKQARLLPELFHTNKSNVEIKQALQDRGFDVEYVENYADRKHIAVKLGDIRLIDNIPLHETINQYGGDA